MCVPMHSSACTYVYVYACVCLYCTSWSACVGGIYVCTYILNVQLHYVLLHRAECMCTLELSLHCLFPLLLAEDGCTHLTGMGCLIVTENQAFFYNLLFRVVPVHKFSFIQPGKLFCYDGDFLHVLNEGGLETYTTRLLPASLQVLHRPIKFDGRCAHSVISRHSDIYTGNLVCVYVCTFVCTHMQWVDPCMLFYICMHVVVSICFTFTFHPLALQVLAQKVFSSAQNNSSPRYVRTYLLVTRL